LKPGGSRTARTAGNGALAVGEAEAQIRRLRDKAKRLDRRLEEYLESAVSGRMNQDKLRSLGLNLATEQLQLEERLLESHKLAELQASEAERRRQRDQVLRRLRENWSVLAFGERRDLIRAVLDRIVVKDDGIEMVLKS
jgi:replicative DNA helicase